MDSRERRSSPRQPIKLAAQIDAGNGHALPCQIADVCAEGVFIRYSAETSRKLNSTLSNRQFSELVVRFRGLDTHTRYELYVNPVRRVDGAMGASFARPAPGAIDAMRQLCSSASDLSRSSLKPPNERVQFVLHQCARIIIQFIEPLMSACLVQMADALQQAARKAGSNQLANDYMDACGQVQTRQQFLWHQMARCLESPLKPERKGVPGAELSVVDKNEFEDWLAIRIMVTRADTHYRGELLQLKLRLDELAVTNRTGHHNPLGPALVCEAFHNLLMRLKVSRDVEKICLKIFEQGVVRHLAPMYQELNNILIRHGILPDLDLSRYLSEQTSQKAKPVPAPAPASPESGQEGQKSTQKAKPVSGVSGGSASSRLSGEFRDYARAAQTAFMTVRNLLGTLQAGKSAAGQARAAEARPLSEGELNQELKELQLQAVQAVNTAEVPLRARVVEKVSASGESRLDKAQEETLDVVDRFFCSVVESPKLSEYARHKIRQLEVPVLKVVMRDPAFFEDQGSPVRAVMNRLAQLGVKGGRLNPVVQRRVDELVQRIATEFEEDTGVFEQTVGELDTLIDRQNLVYRRNVERVTAAAEGAQKVSESKATVSAALDQRLAGRQVPKALVSLLDSGWRDLLSLTWIRHGPDSQLWQDYLAVVDSLLAFAADPDASINLPELLRMIQDGLASISSNHLPSSQVRDELKRFLVRKPGKAPEMVEMPPARMAEADDQSPDSQQAYELQRWISRATQLRSGEWLKDQTRPGEPHYIRLVWVARGGHRFVFVNHQGMRVVELGLEALAEQMRDGLMVPDDQYELPLVDESIDRMVCSVYDQLSWVSTHDELTGLLNRREFERGLEQGLTRPEEARALLQLDVRGFRLLNDTAGYEAGDETLRQVAGLLRQQAGDSTPVARLSGNEFAMVVASAQRHEIAGGIISEIENQRFEFSGHCYRLTASIGLVPDLPGPVDAGRWLRSSEQALVEARKLGPGKIFEYDLTSGDQARQEQIADRIASLDNPDEERMLLRCQKIIPLHASARMPVQYDILISMYDDSGELITGQDFVRMAERYNRMQAVDRWVVGQMLDWLRDTAPDAARVGGVCVNLSGQSLNDSTLLELIYEKLSEKNAPIERLWFKLTGVSSIQDVSAVADFIREMQELGCRFCLANFGSGPGSFELMRLLPVDLIKIDQSFTRQLESSETDRAMVKSMVDMAHYLSREVIASRVESREVLDLLKQLGVDYAQGFAIEKPRLLDSLI